MFIFLSWRFGGTSQGLVSLEIPGVETAGKPHREDTKQPSLIHRVDSLVLRMTKDAPQGRLLHGIRHLFKL